MVAIARCGHHRHQEAVRPSKSYAIAGAGGAMASVGGGEEEADGEWEGDRKADGERGGAMASVGDGEEEADDGGAVNIGFHSPNIDKGKGEKTSTRNPIFYPKDKRINVKASGQKEVTQVNLLYRNGKKKVARGRRQKAGGLTHRLERYQLLERPEPQASW
ncbi:hypothetical protein E3N88_20714 [Mikania micrantha]|uniref:Uncharacterized protein n=1 Tax=Mikania micrantha TaxID=192012 RepID=A0A5N6NHT8_9ASTR|nr:hypothetical protein E3N88_20714 [Mikania micrantha]